MTNLKLCLVLASILLSACSPSQRAINALNAGNQCEFCRISAESTDSDYYSINNLGLCHENGWCGYTKDSTKAIELYTLAARWGVPTAIDNLAVHGITAPHQDLKIGKEQQNLEAFGKLLAVTIVAGLTVAAAKNAPPANNRQAYQPVQLADNDDLQGCCSWHQGISRDVFNNPLCHYTGKVLCKDFQPSPTCRCP
jgi:TPR repeat protein